ncbi:MAG: cupin domain-containing protein [Woeseiaceae bacterium]|nr:cupin domain-containing protein [Woeseiaceae bacterium]
MTERYTVEHALGIAAGTERGIYGILLQHGTLELGFYKPEGSDPQEPHDQDEIYIIRSGTGFFVHGENREPFEAGEALFVPAGDVHRFEEFSDDFAAWVIFYGPTGGE